jgi:acetyl-CoA acetyltransferase
MVLQQLKQRLGTSFKTLTPTAETSFLQPSGLIGPGHLMSLLARRHMHEFGTRREAFAEIAISQRENARTRPTAIMRDPLTLEDYFKARMICEPLCLYDFCLETDGCVAVITTTADRAKDCRQPPVYIMGAEHGAEIGWGRAFMGMQMSDDYFASGGHRSIARNLYEMAGVSPTEIDVACIYDHFTPMVIMQLEDYGFCKRGEGGPFVESGAVRFRGGSIPVNPHGGQLSDGYVVGMTHVREAVEQLRGQAVNQVAGAEIALVTGGPANMPISGAILRR